jgi:SPX domain protein involved in polyphosphate accumulation
LKEWHNFYLEYKRIQTSLDTWFSTNAEAAAIGSLFVRVLEEQIEKINLFFLAQEAGFAARHVSLSAKISRCGELAHPDDVRPLAPSMASSLHLKQHMKDIREVMFHLSDLVL